MTNQSIVIYNQYRLMGNKHVKDPKVNLDIEVDKQFYYAGQLVQGRILMNVAAPIRYDALYLRLQGVEYCKWKQGSGKNQTTYIGGKECYLNENIVKRYYHDIEPGNYIFPFSFVLNSDLTGTYFDRFTPDIKISFPLTAYLADFSQAKDKQFYTFNLTVIEPMRYPQVGRYSNNVTSSPQTCCCIAQGDSYLKVDYPKNTVRPGDDIPIRIEANNYKCQKDIKRIQVTFCEHLYVTSKSGRTFRNWKKELFKQDLEGVPSGASKFLEANVRIPPVIDHNTTFGTFLGNYYTIQTKSVMRGCICCCGREPTVIDHFYVQINQPLTQPKPNSNMPQINPYNCRVDEQLHFKEMAPFVFEQNKKISFMNRPLYS